MPHDVTVRDRRVARIIKRCLEIPGQQLFQYLDEDGGKLLLIDDKDFSPKGTDDEEDESDDDED